MTTGDPALDHVRSFIIRDWDADAAHTIVPRLPYLDDLVTRDYLDLRLTAEFSTLDAKISALDARIAARFDSQTKWIVGSLIAFAGILVAGMTAVG